MPLGHREEFSRFPGGHFDKVPGEGPSKGGCGDAHQCVDPPKRNRRRAAELRSRRGAPARSWNRWHVPRRPEAREKPAFRTPHPKPRACSSAKSTRRPSSSCHVVRAYCARARRCAEPKECRLPFAACPQRRDRVRPDRGATGLPLPSDRLDSMPPPYERQPWTHSLMKKPSTRTRQELCWNLEAIEIML
jgi:hypothetical protein